MLFRVLLLQVENLITNAAARVQTQATCVTGQHSTSPLGYIYNSGINIFPRPGSNPLRWNQSPTLYRVAIKAGLYRKAV